MWSRQVTAKEIVAGIADAKKHNIPYNKEIYVGNCWKVHVGYNTSKEESFHGLRVQVEMTYKRGDKAIAQIHAQINGQMQSYWDRSSDKIGQVNTIVLMPYLTKDDCSNTTPDRFALERTVEKKIELIYKEFIEWYEREEERKRTIQVIPWLAHLQA